MTTRTPRSIPAIVKALVDPYRRLRGDSDETDAPTEIELTFVAPHSRPTDEQLLAIGRVATTWSIVERMLGLILTRLSFTPEFPGMALTKDLGLDAQAKSVRALIDLHSTRYGATVVDRNWLEIIRSMLKEFDRLRVERNVAVHTVWFLTGSDLASLSARPLTEKASTARGMPKKTAGELRKLADAIG